MKSYGIVIVAIAVSALVSAVPAGASGIRTHVQMCVEALDQQLQPEKIPGIADLFAGPGARRAFYHGCMFPDWGFAVGGMHQAGEDAHWETFQAHYLQFLKDHFSWPWSDEAKREIAFYLGAVAHGAQDIPWHFDGPARPSYLKLSDQHDKLKHEDTEKFVDALVYIRYHREGNDPLGKPDCAWPFATLLAVYGKSHPEVTKEKLQAGCQSLAAGYLGSGILGELHRKELPKKYPWNAAHLADYYYGGIEAGAAMTGMLAGRYYARLLGGAYLQRDLEYKHPGGGFTPFEGVADAHVYEVQEANNTGLEPLFELTGDGAGDARHGVVRFDLSALPPGTQVGSARLWLYLAGRRGSPQTTPKVIEARPLIRPWKEGTGSTDEVAGYKGVPATGGGVSYKDGVANGAGDPADVVTIRPGEPVGRWLSWDVTPIVRRHIAHPDENLGILLRETQESAGSGGVLQLLSSQALKAQADGYGGGARLGRRPVLVVLPIPRSVSRNDPDSGDGHADGSRRLPDCGQIDPGSGRAQPDSGDGHGDGRRGLPDCGQADPGSGRV